MPLFRRMFPSMFHRRLLLLAGVASAGMGAIGWQAFRLGVLRHDELLGRAESRLIARHWTPTVRGRILDRKDRVLAEDRPSFDLAILFDVIEGKWPREQARVAARKAYRGQWDEMTLAQREVTIARFQVAYDAHQQAAWTRLARVVSTSPADFEGRRREVIELVSKHYDAVVKQRRAREMDEAAARGDQLNETALRAIERRIGEPIWEQGVAHTLTARVNDAVAVELDHLEGTKVDVIVGENDRKEPVVERLELIPGLRVVASGDRVYPMETMRVQVDRSHLPGPLRAEGKSASVELEGVAIHLIGWLRDHAQDEDIRRRATRIELDRVFRERVLSEDDADRGFYDPALAERVGSSGVEASMESDLRGLRGQRIVHLETGTSRTVEAMRGRDVQLTIDVVLQARIQAAMTPEIGLAVVQPWNKSPESIADGHGQRIPNPAFRPVGTPLAGAAVVLDVDSGEVLAMVSTPTFSRGEILAEGTKVFDPAGPWPALNRAIAKPYPPGSIAKPLMLVGAAKRGFYTPGESIDCTGHLFPNQPNAFRCWLYKKWQIGESPIPNHTEQIGHPLHAEDAICVSCNIFFYTLGQRMGYQGVADAFHDFGVGKRWDLGVGTEYAGIAGRPQSQAKMTPQDGIMMAIGQGPVEWTPLHAANAYATIARMGVWMNPRVLRDAPRTDPIPLNLDPAVIIEALTGLGRSINDEQGTGHHIVVNGAREVTFDTDPTKIWIWGKTGTAAGLEFIDSDGPDGPAPRERVEGDHSWYVFMVGKAEDRRPRFAVAVMMEYAGSGGKVSGAICNQIVHALIDEGYL